MFLFYIKKGNTDFILFFELCEFFKIIKADRFNENLKICKIIFQKIKMFVSLKY